MLRFLISASILMTAVATGRQQDNRFQVRVWRSDEGLPGNVVRSIGQTSDGFLWVATTEGLARFNGIDFETIPLSGGHAGKPFRPVWVFTPADGNVWVATSHGGLLRVDDGHLNSVLEDAPAASPGHPVTRLITVDGAVYFTSGSQVWVLTEGARQAVSPVPAEVATALDADARLQQARGRGDTPNRPDTLVDRSGAQWKVENGDLIHRAPAGAAPEPALPDFTGRLDVQDLIEDREGNLWLASPIQGLMRVKQPRVWRMETSRGLYDPPAKTAVQTRDGIWWVANRNGGIDRIQGRELTHLSIPSSEQERKASCLFEDRSGRLWIGAQDGSVYQGTGSAIELRFANVAGLSQITTIAEGTDGWLWFGGKRRLFRWNGGEVEDMCPHPALADAELTTMSVAPDGKLYIGTADGRIISHDGSDFSLIGTVGTPGRRSIRAILPSSSGEIWVATTGSGLFMHRNGGWLHFGRDAGIPDERLTALAESDGGWLWMGSLGGILRASRSELLDWADRRRIPPRWLRLDRSDGLGTRECSGGAQPGAFKAMDGTLWFPTAAGLAAVNPDRIAINNVPPGIHFDNVEIDGIARDIRTGVLLAGPGRSRLACGFTGLSLSAPEKVTYQIRLTGINDDFRFIGSQRSVNYEALPPGGYTFEVRAVNGDGFETPRPATFRVEVRPHFWQTAWFITCATASALMVALGVGWIIARRRSRRKIDALKLKGALQAERSRISRDLHDDIGASLTELSIRSLIAAENPDDSRLRPSLDHLALSAKHIVGALDEIVWATNPSKDSLQSLIEYAAFFARRFLSSVNIALQTDIPRDIPEIAIGPRRRHNVLLATREALNNTAKHANATKVLLTISLGDGTLVVKVRDDGQGFSSAGSAFGNGLGNMHQRMADFGGTCLIESSPGAGTTITLTMPL